MEVLLEETETAPSSRDRARALALDGVLARIKDDPSLHNKNFKIARYEKRSSASGAQTALRGRYGEDETCAGFKFGVAADDDKAHPDTFVLITHYDPSKVVEGNLEKSVTKFKANEKAKAKKYKENKKKREAEAATGGGESVTAEGAADLSSDGVAAPDNPPTTPAAQDNPTGKATKAANARKSA